MTQKKAFFEAVRAGNATAVKSALDTDAALASAKNEQGQSAVMLAIYTRRNEVLELLLQRGAVLELHEAAAAGRLPRVKELVEKNASLVKSFSSDGFPALALAAVFNHRGVAEYLLEKGADVNAVASNGSGYTALTGAVTGGHKEMVAWLLEKGANVNHHYGPGYSPLLAAAANGHLEIVKLLLNHGADPHAKTNDGQTALNIAETRKHTHVAEFLRSLPSSR